MSSVTSRKNFGNFLRNLRETQGHSLRDVEGLSGVTYANIHYYEKAKHAPRFEDVYKLSKALRFSMEDAGHILTTSHTEIGVLPVGEFQTPVQSK